MPGMAMCSGCPLRVSAARAAMPRAAARVSVSTRGHVHRSISFGDLPRGRPLSSGNSGRSLAVCAAGQFGFGGGGGGGGGGSELEVTVEEHSRMVNEELLLFFFQLDFQTRLNKALIMDDYDQAKALQEKVEQIDEAVAKQQEQKRKSGGEDGAGMSSASMDIAAEGLRLRSELQRSIDSEDYGEAARLRDALSSLEGEQLAAAAAQAASEIVEFAFCLGQKVQHTEAGYKGVVCGFDPVCCEEDEWIDKSGVTELKRGLNQPFYQVLVDQLAWGEHEENVVTAYVAEELLEAPQMPWQEPPVDHPYSYLLFLGEDNEGNYIPTRQLRERYGAERKDVYEPSDDEGEEGDEEE